MFLKELSFTVHKRKHNLSGNKMQKLPNEIKIKLEMYFGRDIKNEFSITTAWWWRWRVGDNRFYFEVQDKYGNTKIRIENIDTEQHLYDRILLELNKIV